MDLIKLIKLEFIIIFWYDLIRTLNLNNINVRVETPLTFPA